MFDGSNKTNRSFKNTTGLIQKEGRKEMTPKKKEEHIINSKKKKWEREETIKLALAQFKCN